MFASKERYFLPLSSDSARRMLEKPEDLSQLRLPELAALLLVQNLRPIVDSGVSPAKVEVMLANTLAAGLATDAEHGAGAFAGAVAARFDPCAFANGLALLEGFSFDLLDADAVEKRDYLTTGGTWDFTFRLSHSASLNPLQVEISTPSGQTRYLSKDQARIFERLRREPDEHLSLQGLAGVGKTAMISTLLEYLRPEATLLLAHTPQQLQALTDRLGTKRFVGRTFGQLASQLLFTPPSIYRKPDRQRYQPTFNVSFEETAKVLGFQPVAGFSPARVADICNRAVQSFCYSAEQFLSIENLPLLDVPLSEAEQAALLGYASLLWQEITQPRLLYDGRRTHLPIRVYHLVKLLSLDKSVALSSADYRHIVIDESHDLSAPLLQFLDRCPQATVTLGDVCQRLDGVVAKRGAHVRQAEISQSVRSGPQIEAILNPLIAAHPRAEVAPLIGARDRKTVIDYYERSTLPEDGTTILTDGEWGLFEWFQRLASANASFCLMPDSEKQFRRFVEDCIELYHHGSRPKHGALFRHGSWESLERAYGGDQSFRTISTMLDRGYRSVDFERSMAKLDRTGHAKILLGRVRDARSLEMDRVMLGRDLLSPIHTIHDAARTLSHLYTGGSRARYKLIVPGELRDWLVDQTSRLAR